MEPFAYPGYAGSTHPTRSVLTGLTRVVPLAFLSAARYTCKRRLGLQPRCYALHMPSRRQVSVSPLPGDGKTLALT